MPKFKSEQNDTSTMEKATMGESPAVLAKRKLVKSNSWCPQRDIEYDAYCDMDNPKNITYRDIVKAYSLIKNDIPKTALARSKSNVQMDIKLYYKYECFHNTGSFHERGALHALKMLNEEQRENGVITASNGNWAMVKDNTYFMYGINRISLAYHGQRLHIPVTVILPTQTMMNIVEKCQDFNAKVVLFGTNLADAKRKAFTLISEGSKCLYINGYDHPDVIAAAGSIGLEILEQLPDTEAILVPVGGGALVAGVATAVKRLRPEILIYGVESDKCCRFSKEIQNERSYQITASRGLAQSLFVPAVGWNSYRTAKSLIDKMKDSYDVQVIVNDDWIARAILHLVEQEKIITEGAGAITLGALLAFPDILPELRGKTVVCIITGGNIDSIILTRCLERAKAVEGRLVRVTVTLPADSMKERLKVLSIIANVGCNILRTYTDRAWLSENDFETIYLTLVCETRNLAHSCTLKRVLEKLFPNKCEFIEEPFSPIPMCVCFPKRFS